LNDLQKLTKTLWEEPHKLGWILGYDKLSEIHSEWIKYIFQSKDTVVLQAHRNAYKTTAMVVGVIRHLLFYPETTILIMRKSATDAEKILQEIQQHYEREPLRNIYQTYGVKEPMGDKWRASSFSLSTKKLVTKEANVECLGIDSSLTGAHYDKILLDDIITIDDRMSKTTREKTKVRLAEMVNIPRRPHGTISVTGTPWHPDDGYKNLPPPKTYSIYTLDPPILGQKEIDSIREKMPPSLFAANYELKHISDNDRYFKNPQYAWIDKIDPIGFIDTAFGGGNNTAFAIGFEFEGLYYLKGWSWPESIVDLYSKIASLGKSHHTGSIEIETNADKGASFREFKKYWPSVREFNERENKHNRIINYLYHPWKDVRIDPSVTNSEAGSRWLNNLLAYEEGVEPDDEADSAAGLMRRLYGRAKGSIILGNLRR